LPATPAVLGVAEREYPKIFLNKGWSTMSKRVMCDHGTDCTHDTCAYRKPGYGGVINNAMCNHVKEFVNVHELEELPKDNPNIKFRNIKHGL
jgi:hypothetical protein